MERFVSFKEFELAVINLKKLIKSGTAQGLSRTLDRLLVSVNQPGHGLSVGHVVRATAANTYARALADSAMNAESVGVVADVLDGDNFVMVIQGMYDYEGGVPAGQVGEAFFLSAVNAGELSANAPVTPGQISKPVVVLLESGRKMLVLQYRGMVVVEEEEPPLEIYASDVVYVFNYYEALELEVWDWEYTVPAGVSSIRIQGWGTGGLGHPWGSGYQAEGDPDGGGGGGGGAYAEKTISVTEGQYYYGSCENQSGDPVEVYLMVGTEPDIEVDTLIMRVAGGKTGYPEGTGEGGQVADCSGYDTAYAGGDGYYEFEATHGGGGGAAAGPQGAGADAQQRVGGIATTGGGNGGCGGEPPDGPGTSGSVPGGGCGGSAGLFVGGWGAGCVAGLVRFSVVS